MIGSVLRIRYELLQELSNGPIFTSYRARDRVQGRDVQVRVVNAPFNAEAEFVEALRGMVSRLSQIRHPGLERIYEVDEHEGWPFLVGDVPLATPLVERAKRLAPFSAPVAMGFAIHICEALVPLHQAGIVHGDVDPRNISVGQNGETRLALASLWETYSHSRTAGSVVLPYLAGRLAPEITEGRMPSPASDVYAVGVLLYELLTGRPPFTGDTPVSLAIKHATAPAPSVRTLNAAVPMVLDEIVRKAMSKSPADRYNDASAMLADLRVMSDAMRFGRPVSWPISAGGDSTDHKPSDRGSDSEPQPIAPKMGAVRPEKVKRKKERAEEDWDRLPRWLTGLVYLSICAAIVLAGGFVYWNLTKPKDVKVPNIVSMHVTDANQRLKEVGLTLRVARETASDQEAGTVLETRPSPGQEVRSGRTVSVVLSSGSRFVEVPDVRGMKLEEAREMLRSNGLQIEEPPEEERNKDVPAGSVLDQKPEPRRKIERGSRITLTISSGDERPTTTRQATKLSTYELKITINGEVPLTVRVDMTDDVGTRTVYEQDHKPGDVFTVSADGEGARAIFRIFYDGELVKQVEKEAAE